MTDEMKGTAEQQPQPAAQPTPPAQPAHESKKAWLWIVGLVILALLAWWLGSYHGWWGMTDGTTTTTPSTQDTNTTNSTSSTSTTGGAGAGSSTPSTSITASSPLVDLYAAVKTGQTETEVTNLADGVEATCVTVAATGVSGEQKACTYVDGGNVVVVTYQDGKVLSVTKSGF